MQVMDNDMFLHTCTESFIEQARRLLFEMFCRIHQKISIKLAIFLFIDIIFFK